MIFVIFHFYLSNLCLVFVVYPVLFLMRTAPFSLLLAESQGIEHTLYPFTALHCAWELSCGCLQAWQVYELALKEFALSFAGRPLQHRSFAERFRRPARNIMQYPDAPLMIVRAEILPQPAILTILRRMAVDGACSFHITDEQGDTIGLFLMEQHMVNMLNYGAASFEQIIRDFPLQELPVTQIPALRLQYLWQTLDHAGAMIAATAHLLRHRDADALPGTIYAVHPDAIVPGRRMKIMPGVVIDASAGPVVLGDDITIMPHSMLQGPCFIGNGSTVKAGALLYGGTVIGPACKVGGEIENSIFHGYSNKQHEGFVGHSYIGEWVNLGALTTTSDLKNTYGTIQVQMEKETMHTGRMFLGLLCGDHTKTAIGTLLGAGTVAGISSNILSPGSFAPKNIRSFSWGGQPDSPDYQPEKAMEVATTVMKRRGKNMGPAEKAAFMAEWHRIYG
jgi:UDP-N-acetylglucosamine diphosphorylase/glucosamine-1-phosphate N-acetyltransferase